METLPTPLPGALILKPKRFQDPRGFFCEAYSKRRLEQVGLCVDFIQDNLSYSKARFTLRGLHFQTPPCAQAKLVSVVKGAVRDVIVDLRRSSPTFGQHSAIELSAEAGNQLFVPIGFAHGFITLEPDTVFTYKVSNNYSPAHDTGICFDDAKLGIDWGANSSLVVTSEKDQTLPGFDPDKEYFS